MKSVSFEGKSYYSNGTGVLFDDKNHPVLMRFEDSYIPYDKEYIDHVKVHREATQKEQGDFAQKLVADENQRKNSLLQRFNDHKQLIGEKKK